MVDLKLISHLEDVNSAPVQKLRMPMDFSPCLNMSGRQGKVRQNKDNKGMEVTGWKVVVALAFTGCQGETGI